jgi:hypothetical protein
VSLFVLSPEIDDRVEVEVANWANVVTFFCAPEANLFELYSSAPSSKLHHLVHILIFRTF